MKLGEMYDRLYEALGDRPFDPSMCLRGDETEEELEALCAAIRSVPFPVSKGDV